MATRKILYTKWGTIALLTTIVLAANIFAVVTTQIGSSPLKPAISSVFASIALQSLHIYVLDFEHQKVPHVRWVLIVALFLACSAHVSFITLFAVLRKDLFYNLSKLLCIFHAIFAEVRRRPLAPASEFSRYPTEHHQDMVVDSQDLAFNQRDHLRLCHDSYSACLLRRRHLAASQPQFSARLDSACYHAMGVFRACRLLFLGAHSRTHG